MNKLFAIRIPFDPKAPLSVIGLDEGYDEKKESLSSIILTTPAETIAARQPLTRPWPTEVMTAGAARVIPVIGEKTNGNASQRITREKVSPLRITRSVIEYP